MEEGLLSLTIGQLLTGLLFMAGLVGIFLLALYLGLIIFKKSHTMFIVLLFSGYIAIGILIAIEWIKTGFWNIAIPLLLFVSVILQSNHIINFFCNSIEECKEGK